MTKKLFAQYLARKQRHEPRMFSTEEAQIARANKLFVVYYGSKGMSFRGAIHASLGLATDQEKQQAYILQENNKIQATQHWPESPTPQLLAIIDSSLNQDDPNYPSWHPNASCINDIFTRTPHENFTFQNKNNRKCGGVVISLEDLKL